MNKILLLLTLYFIGVVAIFTFRPLGDNNALLEQSLYLFSPLIASTGAFLSLRAYGRGPRFRSLLCLTLGLISWLIADTTFNYLEFVAHNLQYPSPADYIYLLAYILLFTGLMLEVDLSDLSWKKINKKVYFIAGVFSSTLLALFSYISVFSSYSPEATLGENVVTIGYTVGDILLVIAGFFILLVVWEYRGGKASKVWINLFLGFLVTLIADLIYANFTDEFETHIGLIYSVSQYCYILGYMFITYGFFKLRNILRTFQHAPTEQKKITESK